MAGLFDQNEIAVITREALTPPAAPAPMTAFLGRLSLLYGVPFAYLVPDERLLPPESLRLFRIEPRWLDALVGGALSLGRGGMTRHLLNKTQAGNFIAAIVSAARAARPPGRGDETLPCATLPAFAFSGFLLHSRVLEAWPGLEVRAYGTENEGDRPLALLRLERIAPAILLGIADGAINAIEITQPPEGLHFSAGSAPQRKDRVIDVAKWAGDSPGSAALAKRQMSRPLRFTFRVEG